MASKRDQCQRTSYSNLELVATLECTVLRQRKNQKRATGDQGPLLDPHLCWAKHRYRFALSSYCRAILDMACARNRHLAPSLPELEEFASDPISSLWQKAIESATASVSAASRK